jgi:NAD-dependent deacetylase
MKKLVVLSGAGVSAESGISTFRDSGGLWEQYKIEEVATPEAWEADYKMVLEFYNMRRKNVIEAEPNNAHKDLAELENKFAVHIITQNIDDLHERAGSSNVLHLHGEIMLGKSSNPETLHLNETYLPIKDGIIKDGETCENGFQIRPHVVWFGEAVPNLPKAEEIVGGADILLVIGTSLNVYPAANLIHYTKPKCTIYLIDPNNVNFSHDLNIKVIQEKATDGMKYFKEEVLSVS